MGLFLHVTRRCNMADNNKSLSMSSNCVYNQTSSNEETSVRKAPCDASSTESTTDTNSAVTAPTLPLTLPPQSSKIARSDKNTKTLIPLETKATKTIQKQKRKSSHPNCGVCRRRLGGMGFDCRCGKIFCGTHRYSDLHNCSYDYRTTGQEKVAMENPLVEGVKLERM